MFDLIAYWTGIAAIIIFSTLGGVITLYIAAHFAYERLKAVHDLTVIWAAIHHYRKTHPERFKDESH